MKKARAEFKSLAKKNKKEELGKKFASSTNSNTLINQAWNRVNQLKVKDPKKVYILEVNGAQYRDSKSIANKIGDILDELFLPQKLRLKLFIIETKGRKENNTCEPHNKENYN